MVEQLMEQVRLAHKAEGRRVEVEIVRLLGAAPGSTQLGDRDQRSKYGTARCEALHRRRSN